SSLSPCPIYIYVIVNSSVTCPTGTNRKVICPHEITNIAYFHEDILSKANRKWLVIASFNRCIMKSTVGRSCMCASRNARRADISVNRRLQINGLMRHQRAVCDDFGWHLLVKDLIFNVQCDSKVSVDSRSATEVARCASRKNGSAQNHQTPW